MRSREPRSLLVAVILILGFFLALGVFVILNT